MNDSKQSTRIAALHALESTFQQHCSRAAKRSHLRKAWIGLRATLRRKIVRRTLQVGAIAVAVIAICVGGLWARLAAGPVPFDIATPFLASAIEHTLGNRHRVEIGGTQIERDNSGRMSLRIRDMMVRDADGAVIAGAPKAEVAVSTTGLLMGSLHAKRVSLVGAELAVRIETDGQITISTGAERRPLAVTPAIVKPAMADASAPSQAGPAVANAAASAPTGADNFAALMAWIDRFAKADAENEILGELGLKDGNLIVDDRRNGKTWTFEQIDFSLNRYGRGGIIFNLGSENEERPWRLSAAVVPSGYQKRSVQIDARQVSTRDILLAMRLDEGDFQFDIPITGSIRAEIGADFMPQVVEGRLMSRRRADRKHQERRRVRHDRQGGNESRLGFDAAHAGRAVQDLLRQEPRHAAQPVRSADAGRLAVAADHDRRQHRARRHAGRRNAARAQPRSHACGARFHQEAHRSSAGRSGRRRRQSRHVRPYGLLVRRAASCPAAWSARR